MDLSPLEHLMRLGRVNAVRRALAEIDQVPTAQRTEVAALWRRCGHPLQAVRILNPIVRPKSRAPSAASEHEIAEYAASLLGIGAGYEALELLERLDGARVPQAELFTAFARFAQWDYAAALAPLRRYVEHPAIQGYARLVGQVNLAAALVQSRAGAECEATLDAILAETRDAPETARLRANALEILAQHCIFGARWERATALLDQSAAILRDAQVVDTLYVEKWKLVVALRRDGVTRAHRASITDLRARAERRGDHETARDCDRHLTIISGDLGALTRLHFGTPYPAYRAQLARDVAFALPESYHWRIGDHRGAGDAIDLLADLKPGQAMQRTLLALASDFYRGHTTPALHAKVFAGRHFNPRSSPAVVYQLVRRLKAWIGVRGSSLRIVESAQGYRLSAKPGGHASLVIHASQLLAPSTPLDGIRSRLEPGRVFTRAEAARAWACSDRTAGRFLREAVQAGSVAAVGTGPRSGYKLT